MPTITGNIGDTTGVSEDEFNGAQPSDLFPPFIKGSPSPIPVSNLKLWLKADTLVGSDGDAVATWADSSGNGNDATQTSGPSQPILKTGANGINGKNVVRFNGTTTVMNGAFDPGSTGLTVFYVVRTRESLAPYSSVLSSSASPTATTGINWSFAIGNAATYGAGYVDAAGGTGLGTISGLALDLVYFARYRYDRANWDMDGVVSGTVADTSWPTGNFLYAIGHDRIGAPSTSWLDGEIAEIIVYASALSDGDIATVKAYLDAKYGL